MTQYLLDWCVQVPVAGKSAGPFVNGPLGWIPHVMVSNGNLDMWFRANPPTNPDQVCPNFAVYKDGATHQHLPSNYQPQAQMAGNATYAAVECEGYPNEPYTSAQLASLARLHSHYRDVQGVPDAIANAPGERGIGTHRMGGMSFGGHTCPGDIRAAQRNAIITLSQPVTAKNQKEVDMVVLLNAATGLGAVITGGVAVVMHDGADVSALKSAGVPVARVTNKLFNDTITALGGPRGL